MATFTLVPTLLQFHGQFPLFSNGYLKNRKKAKLDGETESTWIARKNNLALPSTTTVIENKYVFGGKTCQSFGAENSFTESQQT